jgi:fatty acid desaturase
MPFVGFLVALVGAYIVCSQIRWGKGLGVLFALVFGGFLVWLGFTIGHDCIPLVALGTLIGITGFTG